MDVINEYLKQHQDYKTIELQGMGDYVLWEAAPWIECADGFRMSVQAGEFAYCEPRINKALYYSRVEVGFPSEVEPLMLEWAESPEKPTDTVYGWIPVEVVNQVIEKHGGIK